ncbi:hypothetical protein PPERSA_10809 [Pseudocohnilembus persalinus]|uniref:Uncharacterized protein n=1 Tax=Pseudocohnilembus persalinus TaxID=266149 RepID=A0A0V0QDR6_PSEPJ|nr:hypothetical protein PPERSA_10809 [Pseudocohnilembus persalinus]|eukprot:KRX00310.1 hypothetical protein PPERSA_10809 [Pseudocohnilembus persalinus]
MSDWEDFADGEGDFKVEVQRDFKEEGVKIEEKKEQQPQKQEQQQQQQQQGKGKKKIIDKREENKDDDLLGDKKAFKERQNILARKAMENDVANLLEDLDEDLKKQVDELDFSESENYGQIGLLIGKTFGNEQKHKTADIQNFCEELFISLQKRCTSQELQALNKKMSALVLEKQKEEKKIAAEQKKNQKKVQPAKVNVKGINPLEAYESDDDDSYYSDQGGNEKFDDEDDFM